MAYCSVFKKCLGLDLAAAQRTWVDVSVNCSCPRASSNGHAGMNVAALIVAMVALFLSVAVFAVSMKARICTNHGVCGTNCCRPRRRGANFNSESLGILYSFGNQNN